MAKKFGAPQKRAKKSTFFIVALSVLLFAVLAYYGAYLPEPGGTKVKIAGVQDIRFGIDIRGGVEAVYAPKDFTGQPTKEQLTAIETIMETRLDNLNILDRDIIVDESNGHVIVRFPWKTGESSFNPAQAMKELGETARLTFKDPQGNVVLEGKNVAEAKAGYDPHTAQNVVSLKLDAEGAKLFSEATGRLLGQAISIYMDDTQISAPVVQAQITTGDALISGLGSAEYAVDLADKINAGALPFAIEAISSSSITPTLGSNALQVMVYAGLVSFLLICAFLLFYYRLPGFVACIALLAQVVGILLAISIPQQTLTLQGIAGIILSIGMGVDANVIISERIKEEINNGAPIKTAIRYGFSRAFSSILDGNVTVAISAVCLMYFGTGALLSFGYSLLVGVILNLFCGATLSRWMTRSLAEYEAFQKIHFFTAKKKEEGEKA